MKLSSRRQHLNEFNVLRQIAATTSKNEKEAILRDNNTACLQEMLYLCYNPYMTYRVQQLELPATANIVQPDIMSELRDLLYLLAKHTTTPTQAKCMISNLLLKCTAENQEWVLKIIKKDLKAGISETTINKVFPGLVPVFLVALALPMVEPKSGDSRWETLQYPVLVEEKYNGMRVVAVCDGENVTYYSREGIVQPNGVFLDTQALGLLPGAKYVLDGEIIGTKYYSKCKPAKKAYDKGKHWEFAQGISMWKSGDFSTAERKEYLGYKIWDVINYDYFISQGLEGPSLNLRARKLELAGMFERHKEGTFSNLHQAENWVCMNKGEVIELFKSFRAKDAEGVMVKRLDRPYLLHEKKKGYTRIIDRTDSIIKLKEFYTADLQIIGCIEGKPGTKHVGKCGALVVSDGKVTSEVGAGMNDDERLDFWVRHLEGNLVGTIVEVQYFEVTPDNSLLLPIFMRERIDRTTCSWY